jgi:2-phosphoglycerate kinase
VPRSRDWDVLLLGGASGVGKSTLARSLARRFDLALTPVDDLQVVLEAMTTPEQQPALHFWGTHPDPGSLTAEEIHIQGIEILHVMRTGLEAVLKHHIEEPLPSVLEGDFIDPALAGAHRFAGRRGDGRVRAVFLGEFDANQIVRNFQEREPHSGPQLLRGQVGALRSRWLAQECERLDVPFVHARPWGTLERRAIEALS